MKKMRHVVLFSILGLLIIIAAACAILYNGIQKDLTRLSSAPIEDVDLSTVADGTYIGSFSVFPVSAEVEVTVKEHKIVSARIVSHRSGKGSSAESIVQSAVQAGSLQIDAVTGATYSSKVLLTAMRNALLQGVIPGAT